MEYKKIYVFVEGDDDIRFFEKIIKPKLQKKNYDIKITPYANTTKKYFLNLLKSIKSMNYDYIYTRDINNAPCVTHKKRRIQKKITNIDENKIIVVIKEIEAWYLAGLNNECAKKIKIGLLKNTDEITKEKFNDLIPKKFERRDFMVEILKFFNIDIATHKNRSFKYFINKYNL